ncbi:unnamed protein product [Peniophora sp. CBMAI 1063]|nr:unnamed protein product [Peniophora sp. CBMAI 1063]
MAESAPDKPPTPTPAASPSEPQEEQKQQQRPAVLNPTSEEVEAVIQAATSQRSEPDGKIIPLKDTRTQLFVGNLPYRVRWQDLKDLFRKAGTVLRADVALGPDNRSRGYGTVLLATAEDAGRAVDMFNGYSWQTRVLEVRLDRLPSELQQHEQQYQMPVPYPPPPPPVQATLAPPPMNMPHPITSSRPGTGSLSPRPPFPQSTAALDEHLAAALGQSLSANPSPSLFGHDRLVSKTLFVGNLPFHVQWQDLKDLFRQAGTILRADVALGADGRSRGFGTVVYATESDAERAVRVFNGYEYNGRALKVHYDKFTPHNPLTGSPMLPSSPMPNAALASYAALNAAAGSSAARSLLSSAHGLSSQPLSPLSNSPITESNAALASRLLGLRQMSAGAGAQAEFDPDFAFMYDGLGASTHDPYEDGTSAFRPMSSSSQAQARNVNAFRPTSSSGNSAFRPSSSSAALNAFRSTSSSSSMQQAQQQSFRPTTGGEAPNPRSLEARLASIPLAQAARSMPGLRPAHGHSLSFSQSSSVQQRGNAYDSPTSAMAPPPLHARSTGAIPQINGLVGSGQTSTIGSMGQKSELPTPPSSSGTGASPLMDTVPVQPQPTNLGYAGLRDLLNSSVSPPTAGESRQRVASTSSRSPLEATSQSPQTAQPPKLSPRSSTKTNGPHPGPISLPPQSAFATVPPPHMSPASPYMVPYMIPGLVPSPLHHPMMVPPSPMHAAHTPVPMMHGSPMHHPAYAQHLMGMYNGGMLMTPHGLPPMTPSMPSFQFHPHLQAGGAGGGGAMQSPPPQMVPHAMFSPGVAMSPGAFFGRPVRGGQGWEAAPGAPVRNGSNDGQGVAVGGGAAGGEPQDYFAGAPPAGEPDYFTGAPPPTSIAGQILRANNDAAAPAQPRSSAEERETAGVGGLLERMSLGGRAYEESPFGVDTSPGDEVPGVGVGMGKGGIRTGSESHARALDVGSKGEGRRASFAQVAGRGL